MRRAWKRFQLIAGRMTAVASLGLGLGGCFDTEHRLTFQPNGSADIAVTISFDKEIADIAALIEAYTKYSPEADKFQQGLCAAVQKFAEASPAPNQGIKVQAEQIRDGERFACRLVVSLPNAADLQLVDPVFQIKQVGDRRYRISVDLSNIPDFSKDAQKELLEALREQLPPDMFPPIPEDELAGLWAKHVTAAVALTRLIMRDHSAAFTVAAPRIVESNGVTLAPDGSAVSIKLSFVEMVTMAMDRNARGGKIYYAVVEY
jgi:hypothetical protein